MSIRNLDSIFKPQTIALIGASTRPHSVGNVVARNLLEAGFDGAIMPANPHHRSVAGVLAYPDVKSLPVTPDLAVIVTPAAAVPGLVAELGARGTKGVIVVTAGFADAAQEGGRTLEAAMLAAAKPYLMRIVGPNCLGVLSTPANLNASFAHIAPRKGDVAFVAQSGAILTTVLDWATTRGIGFSHLVSLGDMADVDFGDMLDYLALDPATNAILLYVEAVTHARKFMSAARSAARLKPVIVVKAGRAPQGAKAAASHTGALAGVDGVYDAAFERAGMLRVQDLDELFDALETLAYRPPVHGERLAILTNGGGAGVLATDALVAQGGTLAELSPQTIATLTGLLPKTWSRGNPVDIIGDADGARYAAALDTLLQAPEADAALVLNCPTAVASGLEAAQAVVGVAQKRNGVVLTNWLGSGAAQSARQLFASARIPTFETPEKGVRGFMHLVRYRRAQSALMEAPPSLAEKFAPDDAKARAIVGAALAAGETWLNQLEVNQLLECYRIPVAKLAIAASPDEAAKLASTFDAPVALKIHSPDITHKSDVGGVALDLRGADSVRAAAQAMRRRVEKAAPGARIDGFVVQEMAARAGAHELILGMATDETFGPFMLFGHGGTAVEVIADKALGLPPLNMTLARAMIAHTRVYKELVGYRDQPPAALDEIAATLVKLSQLVCDLGEIVELDINPLLADDKGVIALDARVKIAALAPGKTPSGRLAIKPYPKELEAEAQVSGFGVLHLRAIRPEDAARVITFFNRLSPEDVRLRFLSPMRALAPALLARLTQIDYDREMAFTLLDDAGDILGISRLSADPDNLTAEFAVSVRSDLKSRGLGRFLLTHLIAYARSRGISEVFGYVLNSNDRMLALCRELGFEHFPGLNSSGMQCVRLVLQRPK